MVQSYGVSPLEIIVKKYSNFKKSLRLMTFSPYLEYSTPISNSPKTIKSWDKMKSKVLKLPYISYLIPYKKAFF